MRGSESGELDARGDIGGAQGAVFRVWRGLRIKSAAVTELDMDNKTAVVHSIIVTAPQSGDSRWQVVRGSCG
jgi:hypothetical protein